MKIKIALSLAVLAFGTSGCGSGMGATGSFVAEIYVLVPSETASSFTSHLASLVGRRGMKPNPGQVTRNDGDTTYVLEATSDTVRLWSQNALLSGHEDAAECGVYNEPHSDPGQYTISVLPNIQGADPRASRELLAMIASDLKAEGYDVVSKQPICSPLSKARSKR